MPWVLLAATGGDTTFTDSITGGTIVIPYAYALSGLPDRLVFGLETRAVTGKPTRSDIFTVAEFVAEHGRQAARGDAAPEVTAAAVHAWGLALEEALRETATRDDLVILPARASAAGALDITESVCFLLAEKLAWTAPKPGP